MKRAIIFTGSLVISLMLGQAVVSASPSDDRPEIRLTVELRDGSRVVGRSLDESFKFRSALLGELKLDAKDIRSIDCSSTNAARLNAANGDQFAVNFVARELRVSTTFGKVELPVASVRRVSVSVVKPGRTSRPGLVALWSGEGNGDDSAGGNNAVMMNISFDEGKVGQAFSLNGVDSWMKIPASPALNLADADGLTLMAWIKPSNVTAFRPIFEWNDYTGLVGTQLWLGVRPGDQGVLHGSIPSDQSRDQSMIAAPRAVVSGVFQHVAMTYDKATGQGFLYLNGAVVARGNWGSFSPLTRGDLLISRRPGDRPGDWTYNAFFAGLLDELAIYNRALSAAEVKSICADENGGQLPPPPQAPDSSRSRFPSGVIPPPGIIQN